MEEGADPPSGPEDSTGIGGGGHQRLIPAQQEELGREAPVRAGEPGRTQDGPGSRWEEGGWKRRTIGWEGGLMTFRLVPVVLPFWD